MTATADAPATADPRTVAATALPPRMIAAWTAHDPDALAAIFHETGTMILPGVYCKGREEIRAFFEQAFRGVYRGSQVTGQPISLEFFGDTTAVLISKGGVVYAGQNKVAPADAIRSTWVVTADAEGTWLLAAYQNSPHDD